VSPNVALITGASQGIGAGLVAGYRRAGYAVVGVALSMPHSDEADYVAIEGDVAQADTARDAVDKALDRFGRIDTLVNNAGIYIGKAFTEYTLDDYRAITTVNLAGFFNMTQRVVPTMMAQGSGHIVNVSTSLVDHADSKRPAALAALTKGGLVAATRSLAIEYASHGVRANAVSLGVIKTPQHDPASYDALGSLHPLGHVGEVADVVDGILYLERATFVTGEILHIDGGQAAGH
jgi:NAD(P)-dependent dehydrogenase (short-subunit alcohol dehydrogenase family)